MLIPSFSAFDPKRTSILACLGRRPRGWRRDHLLAAADAASTGPHDLASRITRHNIAPAFRAGISCNRRNEVVLRADIGAHHVMKHRNNLRPLRAASRAHRLVRFNLHRAPLRASSRALCSVKSEQTDQPIGDAGRKVGVVHVNVDRSVQRRRHHTRVEAYARDLCRGTVTPQ
jgi:hypothetical protein